MVNVNDVAAEIIEVSLKKHYDITNLRLQKLMYFVQGWWMLEKNDYNDLLFEAEFQAWDYGPVIPTLYSKYKIYGSKQIKKSKIGNSSNLKHDIKIFIADIVEMLSKYTTMTLVRISHMHRVWREAYRGENMRNDKILQSFKELYE